MKRQMYRVISALVLCIFIIAALTGCFGSKEINDWAYPFTIGMEKGVENKLRFTFQLPTLKGGAGGGKGGTSGSGPQSQSDFTTISIDAPSLYAAGDIVNSSLSRGFNYSQLKYFIVSEDMARQGVGSYINALIRNGEIRRSIHIIVVRGNVKDFIEQINPVLGTSISKTLEDEMGMQSFTGLFNESTYGEFINNMKSVGSSPTAVLAALNDFSGFKPAGGSGQTTGSFKSEGDYYAGEIPRSGGNKTEYMGTALFNADKMVGELTGDESRALLMIIGEFKRGNFSFPDPLEPEKTVSMLVRQKQPPEIKVTFRDGKPVISIKVFLTGDLTILQSFIEYENEKMKPIMETKFRTTVKELLDRTVNKCKGLSVDPLGLGKKAMMHFLTIQEWEQYKWLDKFKDAETSTEVEFILRRTGTMMKSSPIQRTGAQ